MTPCRALAFDLGDTLLEYEGVPLNWEAHYPEALRNLAGHLGVTPTRRQLDRAASVLRRYNTRLHPRTDEVSFAQIAAELATAFDAAPPPDELAAGLADAFDAVLTSRDVGQRKPAHAVLTQLAASLGCRPAELAYVGNERKDIEVALASHGTAILLDRSGLPPAWGQHRTITSLAEL